jgi:hypothetical protein
LGCGLASATFLVITTVGYMLALAQLARALGHFANYLNETAFDDDDDDVDSP